MLFLAGCFCFDKQHFRQYDCIQTPKPEKPANKPVIPKFVFSGFVVCKESALDVQVGIGCVVF
jgi:hypothetical protein